MVVLVDAMDCKRGDVEFRDVGVEYLQQGYPSLQLGSLLYDPEYLAWIRVIPSGTCIITSLECVAIVSGNRSTCTLQLFQFGW